MCAPLEVWLKGREVDAVRDQAHRLLAPEPLRAIRVHLVRTQDGEDGSEGTIEATLSAETSGTLLVIEEWGVPVDQLAAYGAGIQIHVEDLGAYLAGRERRDTRERWAELIGPYGSLAVGE